MLFLVFIFVIQIELERVFFIFIGLSLKIYLLAGQRRILKFILFIFFPV